MHTGNPKKIIQKIFTGVLIVLMGFFCIQVQAGFLGEYFSGNSGNPFPNEGLKLVREENQVFYNWGTGAPHPSTPADAFTARYTGILVSNESGVHTFRTNSDDGVRLYINGTLVINNWTDHGPTINTGTFTLTAGVSYTVRLEYYEAGGGAVIELDWVKPSSGGVYSSLDSVYVSTPVHSPSYVGARLWLRANSGTNCTTSGCTINSWNDQSGGNNHATRPSGSNDTITYTPNLYNFNPGVIFNIGSTQSRRGLQGTFGTTMTGTGASVFFVGNLKNNGSTWPRILSLASNATISDWKSTTFFNITRQSGTNTIMTMQSNIARGNIPNSFGQDMISSFHYGSGPTSSAYRDGILQGTSTHTLGTLNVNNFWIGANSEYVHYIQMDMAEMLVFNYNLSDFARQKIESYLALKYGFTLSNGTKNYIASDELTNYWSTSVAGGYITNIFGIGRDDVFGLTQVQSKSRNTQSILTLQALGEGTNIAPSFTDMADKEFLTVSDNNASATWTATDAPTNTNILSRKWKSQEIGDTGNLSLRFEVDNINFNVPAPLYLTKYYLVRDIDSDGLLADESPEELTNLGGGVYEISGINLGHNQIFTLATLTLDGIHPTITSASIASGSLLPKGNHALNFIYFDNESGIFTGSLIDTGNNIAPTANITATSNTTWGGVSGTGGIANGVISTTGTLDYEYHSDTTSAFIDFNFPNAQNIGNIKIYNRTGCCSERLTGAQLEFYDASNTLLYTYTLPNTTGVGIVDINLVTLGQIHNAKRVRLSTTANYINIREIEIFPLQERLKIYKYDPLTSSYGADIASQVATQSGTLTSTGVSYNLSLTSFGKYRYEFTIRDIAGNIQTRIGDFYIDEPEFLVSSPEIDLGNLSYSENIYSPSLNLTVKTVGAPFTLSIEESEAFLSSLESINIWDGSTGYGYEHSPFETSLSSFTGGIPIISQSGSLNTQGEKNTYTYTLRFGAKIHQEQAAGNYEGKLNFGINLDY